MIRHGASQRDHMVTQTQCDAVEGDLDQTAMRGFQPKSRTSRLCVPRKISLP